MEEAARPKIKRVLHYLLSLKLPIPEIVLKHTLGVARCIGLEGNYNLSRDRFERGGKDQVGVPGEHLPEHS